MPASFGISLAQHRVNGVVQRLPDVGVVGDRAHQRHAASVYRGNTLANQQCGINQQARGNAFGQPMALEAARSLRDVVWSAWEANG